MTNFDQFIIFLQLEIFKYSFNSIFHFKSAFQIWTGTTSTDIQQMKKKTHQHAGIPAQERIRTERSLKKSSWLPISDYITTLRSLPVAVEKAKPPSLFPFPASLIMIILT